MKIRLYMLLILFACEVINAEDSAAKLNLAHNGKALYSIAFDESGAIPSEKNALKELTEYLGKISNAEFTVITAGKDNSAKKIVLGYNSSSRDFLGKKLLNSLGKEEFIIKSSTNGDIYIVGGRPRGTLYGVYHFLDNILGVRWLSPYSEFVPKRADLKISPLNIRQKPAYVWRDANYFIHSDPELDYKWLARNRFNHTKYNLRYVADKLKSKTFLKNSGIKNKIELPYSKYSMKYAYAPPSFVHTLSHLINHKKYFKEHPEWWEEINGKRVDRADASAMCLSNQELVNETAKNAIANIDKAPESEFISISENDNIVNYCQCAKCKILRKKYGNTDSGLLLNFVNQVAAEIHKKYPDIMVTTLAYINTEKPPANIKAGKNILVRLCAWALSHSVPYDDARNQIGSRLFKRLKAWKKICPNIGIWDYVTTYYINMVPHPNLHTIIPNLKAFYNAGVNNYFYEADHNPGAYRSGESLARAFLMSRGLWNPDSNTDELIKDFTNAYYGNKAGKYVREYWNLLESSNKKANYLGMFQGGNTGDVPFLQLKVMLESYDLLQKAMKTAETKQNKELIEQLQMQVSYVLLFSWKDYALEAEKQKLKMPDTFENMFAKFEEQCKKYGARTINRDFMQKVLAKIKKDYYLDFSAKASKCFSSKAIDAFDKDIRTGWNGGGPTGWLEIKFKEPKTINSIYTVFNHKDIKVNYSILGSMDGKTWQTLVPRRTVTTRKLMPAIRTPHKVMFADDKIKTAKVLYVKTIVFSVTTHKGTPDWVFIREQTIK